MRDRRILISGASIAGPTLAYWLHRYGFKVTVVERAPSTRPGGYAVDFRGSSLRVLERMDLVDEVRKFETHTGAITIVDRANRKVASMPDGFTSGELEIMRGDLVNILYTATRQDVAYIFNDSITALRETEDGIDVEFQYAPRQSFDLVVGADGLHSKVRALAFGPESQFLHNLGYYIAIFSTPNFMSLDHSGVYHTVPGKRVGVFSARNNTQATASFYFSSDPLEYNRRDVAEQKQIVRDRFREEAWQIPELLRRMEDAADLYFDMISQVRMDHWSKGRTVLLGDAGYCSSPRSGMGTSLAVVGAYVLAGELKRAAGDYEVAFSKYERQMREFVTEAQKLADGAEWFVPRTRWKLWLSQRLWKILPRSFWEKVMIEIPRRIANLVPIQEY